MLLHPLLGACLGRWFSVSFLSSFNFFLRNWSIVDLQCCVSLRCIAEWSSHTLYLSLLSSRSVVSDSLWPHGLLHARPPRPSPTPGAYSNSCPSSQWCHPTTSSSAPPAFSLSQHQGLFQWVSSSHQVPEVLELQLQHQSFQWVFRVDFQWVFRVDFQWVFRVDFS